MFWKICFFIVVLGFFYMFKLDASIKTQVWRIMFVSSCYMFISSKLDIQSAYSSLKKVLVHAPFLLLGEMWALCAGVPLILEGVKIDLQKGVCVQQTRHEQENQNSFGGLDLEGIDLNEVNKYRHSKKTSESRLMICIRKLYVVGGS